MNIRSGDTALVLLCPAWKRWGTAKVVKKNTTILHARADDVVPFADSEELVRNSGLPTTALVEVGGDHRLADPEPLAAMLRACERAVKLPKGLPPKDHKVAEGLEREIEKAIAGAIARLGLKKLPVLPSQRTMHLMATAAVAVGEGWSWGALCPWHICFAGLYPLLGSVAAREVDRQAAHGPPLSAFVTGSA
jgi:hypothetical protein